MLDHYIKRLMGVPFVERSHGNKSSRQYHIVFGKDGYVLTVRNIEEGKYLYLTQSYTVDTLIPTTMDQFFKVKDGALTKTIDSNFAIKVVDGLTSIVCSEGPAARAQELAIKLDQCRKLVHE